MLAGALAFVMQIPQTFSKRWALASLSLSVLMSSLDTSIANVGLPTLAHSFGASFQDVQWVVLAYLLPITALIVSAGRLGDMIGRKRLLLVGIGVFTAASLLCGAAPTLWLLIAARAAQGVGAAIMMALTMALVGETVPPSETGSAMGLLGAMSAVGTTLGPTLGGVLIATLGWRMIFLVNVPLGILNLMLAMRTVPEVFAQPRAKSPLLQLAMFRDRTLSVGLVASMLVSTAIMATLMVGPFYLSRTLGLSTAHVGLVMSIGPLAAALTGVPAGRIVDLFGAPKMVLVGLVGMACGLLVLAGTSSVAGYVAAIVIVTVHYALFQTANNTAVMSDVTAERRGAISGMLSLSRNLGLISGASVMGAIFAAGGMSMTFIVAALLVIAALATTTLKGRVVNSFAQT